MNNPTPPSTPGPTRGAGAIPDERLLVAGARGGDPAAFERLYRFHYRRVYALALRMTTRVSLAEEVCQQSFVVAWQSLGSFRGDSSFATWLQGIAIRIVLRDQRSERRRGARQRAAFEASAYEEAVTTSMPEARIDLERAIAALPPRARAVLLLHDLMGWRHRDVARQMDIAVGTVKAQLHRARQLVKEALR